MDIFGLMKNEDNDVMEYMQKMYGENENAKSVEPPSLKRDNGLEIGD